MKVGTYDVVVHCDGEVDLIQVSRVAGSGGVVCAGKRVGRSNGWCWWWWYMLRWWVDGDWWCRCTDWRIGKEEGPTSW